MFKNSKGKTTFDAATVVILVIIGLVAWNSGLLGNLKPQSELQKQEDGQPPADTVVKVVGAPCTQATTLTSSMLRRYTEASLGSENVTIFQNNVDKATINNAGTTTVQSGVNGDNLELYPALQSTTYYAQHVKGKITTCTGSATTGDPVFTFVQDASPGGTPITYSDSPNKVMFITDSVTIDMTNDGQSNAQNGILNEAAGSFENLSIGQGGSGSVSLQFKVDYNEGWGVIGGNVLGCQFPQAVYDSVKPLAITIEGVELSEADKNPSTQLFPLIAANSTVKSFKFPGIDGRKTTVVKGTVLVKADSNHNPAMAGDRINCTVFDTNYYKKQNENFPVLDIENRDTNADLGGANSVFDFVIGVE